MHATTDLSEEKLDNWSNMNSNRVDTVHTMPATSSDGQFNKKTCYFTNFCDPNCHLTRHSQLPLTYSVLTAIFPGELILLIHYF